MTKRLPIVGITPGDPCGIGPEVTLKALMDGSFEEPLHPLIIGDRAVLEHTKKTMQTNIRLRPIRDCNDAKFEQGVHDVLDLGNMTIDTLTPGKVSAHAGRASFLAVKKSIELALTGKIDAIVTGPIHKKALQLAGYPYAGHTEIFSKLTNAKRVAMLLVLEKLRVIHVTTHMSLRDACEAVRCTRVFETILLAYNACADLGIHAPKIGVAALNPHASDEGLFGDEERLHIEPAVDMACKKGLCVEGPISADTLFAKAAAGHYDIVVAMYHDQGHIPIKMAGFRFDQEAHGESIQGVNVTIGLPIIRCSVDHGTAFDRVGKNVASKDSMVQAMHLAARLARKRIDAQCGKPKERG